jgi:hypothetical protein
MEVINTLNGVQQTKDSVIIKNRTYKIPKSILTKGNTIAVVDNEVYYNGYYLNQVTGDWYPSAKWWQFWKK